MAKKAIENNKLITISKQDKDGNEIQEVITYKGITLEQMKLYIEQNFSGDELAKIKEEFKAQAIEEKAVEGKVTKAYNHFNARKYFCEKVCPALKPIAKVKEAPKSTLLENW